MLGVWSVLCRVSLSASSVALLTASAHGPVPCPSYDSADVRPNACTECVSDDVSVSGCDPSDVECECVSWVLEGSLVCSVSVFGEDR